MSENADILQLLDEQCRSYSRMFEVGSMQRKCIESEDYEALHTADFKHAAIGTALFVEQL